MALVIYLRFTCARCAKLFSAIHLIVAFYETRKRFVNLTKWFRKRTPLRDWLHYFSAYHE
jgi:cell division protein FtsL